MVNITINDKQLEVPEGTTILEAARSAGIEIPTLCDHSELIPYGGCRLCVVEVEGMRTLQPSCTLPVSNNMVVRTDTQKTHEARKFILNLLFSERNHFCPYCLVSGGDCELQNAAYAEGMTHWDLMPNWIPQPIDASHPYIIIEHDRCILCRRCVRACSELVGNFTLGFEERGAHCTLVADLGIPLGESSCISCGTCVQVCPTGAMIERWSAYHGLEKDVERTQTICVGCSLGCGIETITRDNRLVGIDGDWNALVNHGVICDVGRFLPMSDGRIRLTTSSMRKDGSQVKVSREEALKSVTEYLKSEKNDENLAVISTRLPIEALDVFKQLFSAVGIPTTTFEEGVNTKPIATLADAGKYPIETTLDDLRKTDCVLVIGEDITKDHQVTSFFIKRRVPAGLKIISVSSVPDGLENFSKLHLTIKPRSEPEFLQALLSAFKSEKVDNKSIHGIKPKDIELVVECLKTSSNPLIIFGQKAFNNKFTEAVHALTELAEVSHAKLISTKGGANSLAASQLGLDQPISLDGVKNVFLVLGDEKIPEQMIKKFKIAPNLIVLASYHSPLTDAAQIALPVQTWLEDEGTYLNMDGRLQKSVRSFKNNNEIPSCANELLSLADLAGVRIDRNWKSRLTQRLSPVEIHENNIKEIQ